MSPRVVAREVAVGGVGLAVLALPLLVARDGDGRAVDDGALLARGHLEAHPARGSALAGGDVLEHLHPGVQVDDDDVHVPVSLEVPEGGAAADADDRVRGGAGGLRELERHALALAGPAEQVVRFGVGVLGVEALTLLPGLDGAVGHVEVERPVEVEVLEAHSEARELDAHPGGPGGVAHVAELAVAVPIERVRLAPQVGHVEVEVAVLVEVDELDAHPGLGGPVAVQAAACPDPAVLEDGAPVVDPEQVGGGVVRHVDVEVTVEVRVAHRETEAVPEGRVDSGPQGGVGEAEPSERVEDVRRGRVVVVRAAVVGFAVVVEALDLDRVRPAEVVHDIEVELAVAVGVEHRGARGPARIAHLELRGLVREGAVPVVHVHDVRSDVGHEQVRVPVPVEVPAGRAHAIRGAAHPRFLGHVREAQGASRLGVVPKEAVPGALDALGRLAQDPPLDQIEVEVAVAVVVEHGDAAAHDLGEAVPVGAVRHVHEVHASRGADLAEPDGGRGGVLRGGRGDQGEQREGGDHRRWEDRAVMRGANGGRAGFRVGRRPRRARGPSAARGRCGPGPR